MMLKSITLDILLFTSTVPSGMEHIFCKISRVSDTFICKYSPFFPIERRYFKQLKHLMNVLTYDFSCALPILFFLNFLKLKRELPIYTSFFFVL